jgi:hypothetical protein
MSTEQQRLNTFNADVKNALGVLRIELITPMSLMFGEDSDLQARSMSGWMALVKEDKRPLCLFCDHEWSNLKQDLPSCFVMTIPEKRGASQVMLSAICAKCDNGRSILDPPNLLNQITEAMREKWPSTRKIDRPNPEGNA